MMLHIKHIMHMLYAMLISYSIIYKHTCHHDMEFNFQTQIQTLTFGTNMSPMAKKLLKIIATAIKAKQAS